MKKHIRSHKKACTYCLQLFNYEILKIHEPNCILNNSFCIKCNSNIYSSNENYLHHENNCLSQNNKNEKIIENEPILKEPQIIKKLNLKKEQIKISETLTSSDLKVLTSNLNHSILENRQNLLSIPNNILSLYPWQENILSIMTYENYNNRTIHVLYDQQGGIGKSTFKKYVDEKFNFITITGSQTTSLYPGYQKVLNNLNNTFWNVIIDLPRATQYLPAFAEQIKDNIFPSYNYYQPPLKIANNNIFIFCNNLKLLNNLSLDRIKVYTVENNILQEQKIRLYRGQVELTTGTESTPSASHKYTYCNHNNCTSDCNECKNFMCDRCNLCRECDKCKCKNICILCKSAFATKFNLWRHKKICNIDKSKQIVFPFLEKTKKFSYSSTVKDVNKVKKTASSSVTNKNLSNFLNSTVNNYVNTCKICKQVYTDFICRNCLKFK